MRFIPTRVHGILDYATGLLLIAAPWLLGFARYGAETWIPVLLGAGALAYSLLTDYELGLVKVLPMKAHLALDAASGVLLAASPWLFGFAGRGRRYWLPHALMGATEILAAATTKTR